MRWRWSAATNCLSVNYSSCASLNDRRCWYQNTQQITEKKFIKSIKIIYDESSQVLHIEFYPVHNHKFINFSIYFLFFLILSKNSKKFNLFSTIWCKTQFYCTIACHSQRRNFSSLMPLCNLMISEMRWILKQQLRNCLNSFLWICDSKKEKNSRNYFMLRWMSSSDLHKKSR